MDKILFKTIHGSHLYGLAHADSDQDFYTVVSRENHGARKKYAKQSIHDGIDSMIVDLSTFMHFCEEGVPQALEAMFSPIAEIDMISDLRRGYHVNTAKATRTYRRTIRNFAEGDGKKKRHAVRLAFSMFEFQATGRFSPVLTEDQKTFAGAMAFGFDHEDFMSWLDTILGGNDAAT